MIAPGYRWGVVALGVVAGKETQKKTLKLIERIKTHNTKPRCRNPPNTYTKPPKFSVPLTGSCLQSYNGVSTSNNCFGNFMYRFHKIQHFLILFRAVYSYIASLRACVLACLVYLPLVRAARQRVGCRHADTGAVAVPSM